jgi:hypothetical protein
MCGQKKKRKIGSNTKNLKVVPFLPPWAIVEQDWIPSTVTPSHVQKLMKHGLMSVVELKACQVPVDPAFPALVEGDVESFTAFYEWGFGMPSHQFLCLLLRYYVLKLHHLTPSGVLHIVASWLCVRPT